MQNTCTVLLMLSALCSQEKISLLFLEQQHAPVVTFHEGSPPLQSENHCNVVKRFGNGNRITIAKSIPNYNNPPKSIVFGEFSKKMNIS